MWARWGTRGSAGGALGTLFGALELRVLEALWRLGEASVADVQARLGRRLAYTTVMTTLDRLHKKGALERRKLGRAFVYRPLYSRDQIEHGVLARLLGGLLDGATGRAEPVLSSLVDAVGETDRELLDALERLVRRKRRSLRGDGVR